MSKILQVFTVTFVTILTLFGCQPATQSKEVNVYNWTSYLPEDLRADFTKETGITLNYEEYDSNETMMAKITAGAAYDVAFPSADFVPPMVSEGLIQAIDLTKIPNFSSIDETVVKLTQTFDPGNKYSIPYNIGTTGIVYWKDKVSNPGDSYALLSRPDLKGKTALLDDTREVFGPALASLGFSGNSTNPQEIEKATEVILGWKNNALKFENEQMPTLFSNQEIWVAMNYPENILTEMDPDKLSNVGFFLPKEGGIAFLDNMVILKNAKNLENAHIFINYILKPENLARIVDEFGYPGISAKANELRKTPARYTSVDLSNREIKLPLYEKTELYTQAWEDKIKIGE